MHHMVEQRMHFHIYLSEQALSLVHRYSCCSLSASRLFDIVIIAVIAAAHEHAFSDHASLSSPVDSTTG